MLSELLKNLQSVLKPYPLDSYINSRQPKDHHELEYLEKLWNEEISKGFWY